MTKTPSKSRHNLRGMKLSDAQKWLKTIPLGSHGSGHLQKRLWRLKSDYVRIRDYYKYKGRCVATGKYINRWQDGQAGHFKSYPKCNGMYKFHENNIHLQSAYSNSFGDKDDWKQYEQELIKRYGKEFVDQIEVDNKKSELKITTLSLLEEIERTISMIELLPEEPPYFERLMRLRAI